MELEPFEKEAQGVKQVIVVRKDLNMRKGKIAAQVAHASMGTILSLMQKGKEHYPRTSDVMVTRTWKLEVAQGAPLELWLNGPFAKIVVYVNSEAELLTIEAKAKELNVLNYLIIDSGKTEFNGVPTKTCIAIGPDFNTQIDLVTGGLPLL